MSYRSNKTRMPALLLAVAAIIAPGLSACNTTEPNSTPNVTPNPPAATTPNPTSAPTEARGALEAREPENYSLSTTINIQPTGNAPQTNVPPLQFAFARMGNYHRVSFKLPEPVGEVGEVVYLEKDPLKYLIFPSRNQYVELDPSELGFQLGNLMSPASVIERLRERTQYEKVGTETINGRTAIKYRFTGATDTKTKVGTVQADSLVYVDQDTGLPLRTEVDTISSSGAGARLVTEASDLQLSPDASLFEVPTTMRKVSSAELKQQVQGFVSVIRVFADYLRQHVNTEAAGAPNPNPNPAPAGGDSSRR